MQQNTMQNTQYEANRMNDPAVQNVDLDPDQSTVASPSEHHHEKLYGEGDAVVPGSGVNATGTMGTATTTTGYPVKEGKFTRMFRTCSENPLVTYGIRFWQFAFAAIALGCAANSLSNFYRSDTRMRLTTFTASFTLIYLFFVMVLAFFVNSVLMVGALLITEVILTILWLCSFIGGSARFADISCSNRTSGATHGCRTGKAACAFAAMGFLLFFISSLFLIVNVVRPLVVRNRGAVFQSGAQSGVKMNKSALAFSKYYDLDARLDGPATGVDDVEKSTAYDAGHERSHSGVTYTGENYGANTGVAGTNTGTTGVTTTGGVPAAQTEATSTVHQQGYHTETAGTGTTLNPATGNTHDYGMRV